jgi:hypothetical protein
VGFEATSKQEFKNALDEYAKGMRLSMEDAANVASSRLCIAAMELTPPILESGGGGLTHGAKLAGFNAVARDIKSLFTAKDETKAAAVGVQLNRLREAIKANDQGKFEQIRQRATLQKTNLTNLVTFAIIRDGDPMRAFAKAKNLFNKSNPIPTLDRKGITTDIRKEHLARRHIDRQGRVRIWRGTGGYLGKYVVESKATLDAYIKLTQSHVGFLKAGWYDVLTKLPKLHNKALYKAKDIPVWIKRHKGNGYVTSFRNAYGLTMIIGNTIGDNDGQASKNGVPDIARSIALARLYNDLEQYQAREAQAFNAS